MYTAECCFFFPGGIKICILTETSPELILMKPHEFMFLKHVACNDKHYVALACFINTDQFRKGFGKYTDLDITAHYTS